MSITHPTPRLQMSDLSLMAATEWAQAHAARSYDPIKFGSDVAQVYCTCRFTWANAGDEKATAAALASLSIRPEVLQLIAQLALLDLPQSMQPDQKDSAGAE